MTETNRVYDVNGWYTVPNNPISKVGVFPYLGKQIGAPNPDQIYYVYRSESELSKQETIDSFKLLPWVNDHAMLGGEYTPAEQKGVHGVIGEDVRFEYPYLLANIKVWSNSMAADIDVGEKIELSPGYRCQYRPKVGVFEGQRYDYIQTDILGNHLALVDQGRTGPDVAVLDHLTITLDTGDFMPPKKTAQDEMREEGEKQEQAAKAEESSHEAKEKQPDEGSTMTMGDAKKVIDQMMPMLESIMSFMKGGGAKDMHDPEAEKMAGAFDECDKETNKEEETAMDTASAIQAIEQKLAALDAKLSAMDSKVVLADLAKRDALIKKLAENKVQVATDGLGADEIAVAAVAAIGIQCPAESAHVALDAYFHNRKQVPETLYTPATEFTHAQDSAEPVASSLF